MAGVAIAVASVGSLIGGLAFGHRRLGLPGPVLALVIVTIGTALFGAADGLALQFCALFVSGLGFAPALSALYLMVSQAIDERSATEAFGWLNNAALVGGAIGTAIAGVATGAFGALGAVVVSVILAAVAAVSPIIARRWAAAWSDRPAGRCRVVHFIENIHGLISVCRSLTRRRSWVSATVEATTPPRR